MAEIRTEYNFLSEKPFLKSDFGIIKYEFRGQTLERNRCLVKRQTL